MGPAYAGILGLLAFIVTLARGLIHASSAATTAYSAVGYLWMFAVVGYFAGRAADQVLWDSVNRQFQDEMQAREAKSQENKG